jgi:hypothetical protein
MAEPSDAVLAAELLEIGRHLDVPPPPDVRTAVRARLAEPPPPSPHLFRRLVLRRLGAAVAGWPGRWAVATWPARAVAVAAVLAVLAGSVAAASPRARAAIADFFSIGPIRVHSGPPPPPVAPSPAPGLGDLPPGTRTATLAEAQARAPFRIGIPGALGPPDEVLVPEYGPGLVVALRYGPGPGRPPAHASAVAVELAEVAGTIGGFAEKYLGGGAVERVDVGDAGWWIPAPHVLVYAGPDGSLQFQEPRLAGRTLIWQQGAVTYRLEGAFSKERAVETARSLR